MAAAPSAAHAGGGLGDRATPHPGLNYQVTGYRVRPRYAHDSAPMESIDWLYEPSASAPPSSRRARQGIADAGKPSPIETMTEGSALSHVPPLSTSRFPAPLWMRSTPCDGTADDLGRFRKFAGPRPLTQG